MSDIFVDFLPSYNLHAQGDGDVKNPTSLTVRLQIRFVDEVGGLIEVL